jgi:hypothetical protein
MPPRSYDVRFASTVHISKHECDLAQLPENLKCLEAILQNADLEVEVEINAEINSGWEPSWDSPGGPAQASPTSYKILSFDIYADTKECAETIKLLMTNEQRQAIKEAAEFILDHKWEEDYKHQALNVD